MGLERDTMWIGYKRDNVGLRGLLCGLVIRGTAWV